MKKSGAALLVYALEQVGVRFTFGIPGVHVTEIYDELNKSPLIQPVLVTHEGGGAFMAEGMSRTSNTVGTLMVVPAAGITHAMSGIGEAFLDGIPMLVISGGTRRDSNRSFQLHQFDQHKLLSAITKGTFLIESHQDIIPTIYQAHRLAVSGEPGPVFVEIPVEIQMFRGEVAACPEFNPTLSRPQPRSHDMQAAVQLLKTAQRPGLFLGWGAADCTATCIELAERLGAPVATTLQGLSVFPANHPLHTGMGFGKAAVPAAENAFKDCDCLLAVGVRFSEIPTGSFGLVVPENLIHVDINPQVFHKNYPARVAIESDAGEVVALLLAALGADFRRDAAALKASIAADKQAYLEEWENHDSGGRVNPGLFFESLRHEMNEDSYLVVDDGNHTFLAAELFPVYRSRHFISPTDFNCMGYAVPAAIGVKLAHPDAQVAAVVGDGAFLMTCMEIMTAVNLRLGVVFFIFHDGELSQISQSQEIPYNRKTCTVLGKLEPRGVAEAVGASFYRMEDNDNIDLIMEEAFGEAEDGHAVIVDVRVDYSKRTRFTKGIVKTNLSRFPLGEKVRFISRAVKRKVSG